MVEIDRGRIAEPTVCVNCEALHSMTLVHNRSYFTDKQIVKLQEAPGKEEGERERERDRKMEWV